MRMWSALITGLCVFGMLGCVSDRVQRQRRYIKGDIELFSKFKAIAEAKDLKTLKALEYGISIKFRSTLSLGLFYFNRLAELQGPEWQLKTCWLPAITTKKEGEPKRGYRARGMTQAWMAQFPRYYVPMWFACRLDKEFFAFDDARSKRWTKRVTKYRQKNLYPPEVAAMMDQYLPLKDSAKHGKVLTIENPAAAVRRDVFEKHLAQWVSDDALAPELKLHLLTHVMTDKENPGEAALNAAMRQIEIMEANRVKSAADQLARNAVASCVKRASAGKPVLCTPRWNKRLSYHYREAKNREGTWRKTLCADVDASSMTAVLACSTPTRRALSKKLYQAIQAHEKKTSLRYGRSRWMSLVKKDDAPEFFTSCEQRCEEQAATKIAKNKERLAKRTADRAAMDAKNKKCQGFGAKLEKVRLKWKECMSNADLKSKARRYAVTDKELYDNHMKANAFRCFGRSKNLWKKFTKAKCYCSDIQGSYSYKLRYKKSVSACSVASDKWEEQ